MKKICTRIFLLLACFSITLAITFGQNKPPQKIAKSPVSMVRAETLEQQIVRIARAHRLDPRLFHSLIYTESVFKIRAVSYKGAACYTQLMPATARRFGLRVDARVDERFNPEKCLSVGAYYLAWLLKSFRGDVRLALAGYNAGEGAVMKYGWRVPPYRETVQYVEKICNLYYGQAGHGISLAYNQPLAQVWVNELYNSPRKRRAVQLTSFSKSVVPTPNITAASADNQSDAAVPEVKANDNKKRLLRRVVVDENLSNEPRIRTQSLSFGEN